MAPRTDLITPSSYVGTGRVLVDAQGLYEESATAVHSIGTRLELDDGRVFYYAKNGTTATVRPGVLFVGTQILGTEFDANIPAAVVAGAKQLNWTAVAAITRDSYKDGWLLVYGGAGEGQLHKIAGNTAIHATGTTCTIYLYDELVTALSITSDCTIYKNFYNGVDRATTTANEGLVLGTALIPIQASYYFWLQTYGLCSLLRSDGLGTEDSEMQLQAHASGCSTISTDDGGDGAQVIGYHLYDGTDTTAGEWELCQLIISR